jgi:hypothetical protein
MAVGYLDLFVEQGEDFSADITLDSINGTPYDLSTYSVKSQLRTSYWSANAAATFTSSISANGTGIITISLPHTITANLNSGKYVYDIFLTNNTSNTRSKVLEGTVYLDPSVTSP